MTAAAIFLLTPAGCCWSYFGVVYMGAAVKAQPSAAEIAGAYRVRQYGGGSVHAQWPTDLVLTLHEDGTLSCAGDHSVFVVDFNARESAIDPSQLGRWIFVNGRESFPAGVDLIVDNVHISADLLRSNNRYGLGISQGWGNDPDDRNTLEFIQNPKPRP